MLNLNCDNNSLDSFNNNSLVDSFNNNITLDRFNHNTNLFLILYRDKGLITNYIYGIVVEKFQIENILSMKKKFFINNAIFKIKCNKLKNIKNVYYKDKYIGYFLKLSKKVIQYNSLDKKHIININNKGGKPYNVKLSIKKNNLNYNLKNREYIYDLERHFIYQQFHYLNSQKYSIPSSKNISLIDNHNSRKNYFELVKLDNDIFVSSFIEPLEYMDSFIISSFRILDI